MHPDNKLPKEILEKIIKVLKEKNATNPCPMCGNSNFVIEDGLIVHILQHDTSSLRLYGPGIICAMITCTNCGYNAQFSLDRLGIVDEVKSYVAKQAQ